MYRGGCWSSLLIPSPAQINREHGNINKTKLDAASLRFPPRRGPCGSPARAVKGGDCAATAISYPWRRPSSWASAWPWLEFGQRTAFAGIFLAFPAQLSTPKALLSKLGGAGLEVSFLSPPWIKCVHVARCKVFGWLVWFICIFPFFLKKPPQNRFSSKQSSFYSLCYTQRPFQFTFAPFFAVKIITFFCLLFLICLFISMYFWHGLAKAESSVKLSGSDCFVLLCKRSLRDSLFADTLPLEINAIRKIFR